MLARMPPDSLRDPHHVSVPCSLPEGSTHRSSDTFPNGSIEARQDSGSGPSALIAEALERAVAQGRLPGAVVALGRAGSAGGARIQAVAVGRKALTPSAEPLEPDTVYDVASLTKGVVTATVFARLFERGEVDVDAPVHQLLPDFAAGEGVRLRHLLTHTSGLPASLSPPHDWQGVEAACARAIRTTPTHPPDAVFRYSDVNFILLGAVAQRVTGQALDALAHDWIFNPLGMRDSGFRPLEEPQRWAAVPVERIAPTEWEGDIGAPLAQRPQGARMLRGVVHDPTARRMGGVAGHAGLFASVADLARFATMLLRRGELDGVRVLAPASVDRILAVATPPGMAERRSLGWDIDTPLSRARGLPGLGWSPGSVGHTGFTGCAMWLDPALSAFHVLLSNRVHPVAGDSIVALYEEVATLAARAARTGPVGGPAV